MKRYIKIGNKTLLLPIEGLGKNKFILYSSQWSK